jgi:hypothetical protein
MGDPIKCLSATELYSLHIRSVFVTDSVFISVHYPLRFRIRKKYDNEYDFTTVRLYPLRFHPCKFNIRWARVYRERSWAVTILRADCWAGLHLVVAALLRAGQACHCQAAPPPRPRRPSAPPRRPTPRRPPPAASHASDVRPTGRYRELLY